ncbi:hypothetical protein PQX77_016184, partial [Marasmius sp. AFHP31]
RTTSRFLNSTGHKAVEFLLKLHNVLLSKPLRDHRFINDWEEALDIIRRVPDLPHPFFRPIAGRFSIPLSKLKKTLKSLAPAHTQVNFNYLGSLKTDLERVGRGYMSAPSVTQIVQLARILSDHITNYPTSGGSESSGESKKPIISPLIKSTSGAEIIAVMNKTMAERWIRWEKKPEDLGLTKEEIQKFRDSWAQAMKRFEDSRHNLLADLSRPLDTGAGTASGEVDGSLEVDAR